MTKTVYLFPDTNVLVQCLPLDQLDWSAWREFDEVHLIIARPVQAEIDKHKNKGGERLGRRARKASTLLRDIILSGQGCRVVRQADPSVRLFIRAEIRPSKELADILDYDRPDDCLVGTAHAFAQQNPGADVRVLTHDTGPMASAKMVGVGIAAVPDDWLLPPEPSDADKKIHALQAEVAKLKDTEPKVRIVCLDADQNEVDRLEFEVTRYQPLSKAEVSALLDRIEAEFPIAVEFGARESAERSVEGLRSLMVMKEVFTPATDEQIDEYRESYNAWLKDCQSRLRSLHVSLQTADGAPVFIFAASNDGTRSANDVLVTFTARGNFGIMPAPDPEDADPETEGEEEIVSELPRPPSPPQGRWKPVSLFEALDMLRQLQGTSDLLVPRFPSLPRLELPNPRDPNSFYYKPNRSSSPQPEFSLECEQWRHGMEPELFVGEIHVDLERGEVRGALECHIHAQNLSESAVKLIPVHIRIEDDKAHDVALKLVDSLCGR